MGGDLLVQGFILVFAKVFDDATATSRLTGDASVATMQD